MEFLLRYAAKCEALHDLHDAIVIAHIPDEYLFPELVQAPDDAIFIAIHL